MVSMGEKDVDNLMERLKNYNSRKPVKQKPKDQSNIEDEEDRKIAHLLKKGAEYRKMSLVEKLDYYEKKNDVDSGHYHCLIDGGIRNIILNVLPRYIEIEKLVYKKREVKIILQEVDYTILKTTTPMFESDYNQLLKNYPCVRKVISGLKKKGIKVIYDRKYSIIKDKVA